MLEIIAFVIGGLAVVALLIAAFAMWLGSLVEEDTEKTRAGQAAQMAVTDGEREGVA